MATRKKKTVATAESAVCPCAAQHTRKSVTFTLKDLPGRTVALAGTFNNWQTDKQMLDKDGTGVYRCRLMLEPGEYQYKFVVDGEWRSDCENPNWVVNEFGSFNSVLAVENK